MAAKPHHSGGIIQTANEMDKYVCPTCRKTFPKWYWSAPYTVNRWATWRNTGAAKANYWKHREACKKKVDGSK